MKKIDLKKLKGKKKIIFLFWVFLLIIGLVLGITGIILAIQ